MTIANVIRTPEGGARLLLNGMPTEFSPADVDTLLRALVEPPPEPKPLDVRVGDWVRRHDDILCRVVKVGDGLATLRACDDPEDEEVCGAWAFRVVERLPEGWEWEPNHGASAIHDGVYRGCIPIARPIVAVGSVFGKDDRKGWYYGPSQHAMWFIEGEPTPENVLGMLKWVEEVCRDPIGAVIGLAARQGFDISGLEIGRMEEADV